MFEYTACFQALGQNCDAIICVTIGAEFSTCYQNACLAASDLAGECGVYVVDSRNLSSGQGLLVLEAARLAEAGFLPDEIVSRLEKARELVDASFIQDRLDYMRKGGRCSAIAALGANLLQLKPCIEVRNGKMGVGKKYRGSLEKVMAQYVEDTVRTAKKDRLLAAGIRTEYPLAAKRLEHRAGQYNRGVAIAKQYVKQGKLLIIAPDDTCGVTTLKRNPIYLARLYEKGYHDGKKIAAFLSS